MESKEENNNIKPPSWKEQNYFPARYLISLMAFLGMTCNFMLNVNINFAIQAMVKPGNDSNSTDETDVCNFTDSESGGSDYGGDFEWDEVIQGFVVGAFYWGYIWTQIPGGRLAEVYGPKIMMGLCLGTTSILALFIPLAAHSSYIALIAVRVLQGLVQGPMYPIALVLVAAWAPPNERSMLTTFVCAGDSFGTIIAFPMAAAIADSISWEAIFYIQASISLCWVIFWFLLISDDPKTFRLITDVERKYITSSIGESKSTKSPPIPWRSIALSMPFWSMVVVGLGDSWGWYTLLTELPLYMKEMLKMDMATNALLSSMPYLGAWIFGLSSSIIGDHLLQKGTIKTGLVRKIAQTLAHMGPGFALFTLTFIQCDKTTSIVLFFVGIAFQGIAYVGFIANAVDIAPNFAGTLYGIVGMLSTIPGVVAPITVGVLTKGQQTFSQWNKVFYITFGIYIFDVLFYWIFGSGEEQSWNKLANIDEDGLNLVEKQNNSDEPKLNPTMIDAGHDNVNFEDTEKDTQQLDKEPIKVEEIKASQDENNVVEETSKAEITLYESSQDKQNSFEGPSTIEAGEQEMINQINQTKEPNTDLSEVQELTEEIKTVAELHSKDDETEQAPQAEHVSEDPSLSETKEEILDNENQVEVSNTVSNVIQISTEGIQNITEVQVKDEDIEQKPKDEDVSDKEQTNIGVEEQASPVEQGKVEEKEQTSSLSESNLDEDPNKGNGASPEKETEHSIEENTKTENLDHKSSQIENVEEESNEAASGDEDKQNEQQETDLENTNDNETKVEENTVVGDTHADQEEPNNSESIEKSSPKDDSSASEEPIKDLDTIKE